MGMNPAELANTFADALLMEGVLSEPDADAIEIFSLYRLTRFAQELDMIHRPYLVQSKDALALNGAQEVRQEHILHDISFAGELKEYTIVRSPRILGEVGITGLCLEFNDPVIFSDEQPEDVKRLFVPNWSVESIDTFAV